MVQSVIFNKEDLYCSVGIPSDRQESLLPTDQILSTDCLFFSRPNPSQCCCVSALARARSPVCQCRCSINNPPLHTPSYTQKKLPRALSIYQTLRVRRAQLQAEQNICRNDTGLLPDTKILVHSLHMEKKRR